MIKKLKRLIYPVIFLGILNYFIVYFQSCEQDFVSTPENVVRFPPEIEAIFNTPYTINNITCTTPSCHANENSARGLNLVDWRKAMEGSENGTVIIPYNGFWSHMISALNNDTNFAPVTIVTFPELHKIDPAKDTIIMNWINDGAKSNDGQVAFTNVPSTEKGFITNQAADLVAVVKTNNKQITRLIPVGGRSDILDSPHYITLSPDNKYFYVSLIQEGYIEKYDINVDYPFAKIGRMPAGQSPAHIVISQDGLTGYATNFSSSTAGSGITKFNANDMSVIGILTDQKITAAHGMALTNNGQYLYVASQIGEYIFKINTNTFEIELSSPIDPSVPPNGNGTGNFKPYQVVLSPDNNLLYISCVSSNQVRVYNASNLLQDTSIFVGNNGNPLLMKFTNDGKFLFVCNRNNNTVTIINALNQTVETTVTGVGIQPHGVDFTRDGQYAIIACETQSGFDGHHPQIGSKKIGVSRIIQVTSFTLQSDRLEMGSFPAGIVIVK